MFRVLTFKYVILHILCQESIIALMSTLYYDFISYKITSFGLGSLGRNNVRQYSSDFSAHSHYLQDQLDQRGNYVRF